MPALLLLASCELLPVTIPVEVVLPETPAAWEAAWGPAVFELVWQAAGGARTIAGTHGAGSTVTIDIPRLPPVAIVALPRWTAAGETMLGAGSVWPGLAADRPRAAPTDGERPGGERLVLTFEDGPVAEVLRRVMAAGADVGDFSVSRLAGEIRERLGEDPWALDVEKVVSAIASRAMRESYVRARPAEATGLVAPPGTWLAPSPFVDPVASDGATLWPPLPVGLSVFYSSNGRRWLVDLDEEGRAWQGESPPTG